MEDKYCRNRGQELRSDDRFCPGCENPVHEIATRPTPEADVPIPPPQRQAGSSPLAPGSIGRIKLPGALWVVIFVLEVGLLYFGLDLESGALLTLMLLIAKGVLT
jgi:hypothetical protein